MHTHTNLYMGECTCVHVFRCVCMQMIVLGIFSWTLLTCCLRQGLPLDWNLTKFGRKISQQAPGTCLSQLLIITNMPPTSLYWFYESIHILSSGQGKSFTQWAISLVHHEDIAQKSNHTQRSHLQILWGFIDINSGGEHLEVNTTENNGLWI